MSRDMFNPIGERFGMLVGIDFDHRVENAYYCNHWLCKCDCGNTITRSAAVLRKYQMQEQDGKNPKPLHCGCLFKSRKSE